MQYYTVMCAAKNGLCPVYWTVYNVLTSLTETKMISN